MQRCFKHPQQVCPGVARIFRAQRPRDFRLDPLEVPVAEFMPEEVINLVGRFVESVIRKSSLNFSSNCRQAGKIQRFASSRVWPVGKDPNPLSESTPTSEATRLRASSSSL